jgi:hypothetical protein
MDYCRHYASVGLTKRYTWMININLSRSLQEPDSNTIQNLSKEKNWFLNHLFLKFSSLAQGKIFSDRFGATSSSIIENFFFVDEISYMPIALVEFINEKGKGHFENPDEIAVAVQKAARSSYRLLKTVTDSINRYLRHPSQL